MLHVSVQQNRGLTSNFDHLALKSDVNFSSARFITIDVCVVGVSVDLFGHASSDGTGEVVAVKGHRDGSKKLEATCSA